MRIVVTSLLIARLALAQMFPFPGPGPVSVTVVPIALVNQTVATVITAFNIPAAASGHTLIAILGAYGANGPYVDSIVQTNVTWTRLTYSTNGPWEYEEWYGIVSGTGGTGVTINWDSGYLPVSYATASITEWSNVYTVSPINGQAYISGGSGYATVGSFSTTYANSLVIVSAMGLGADPGTVPTGFTALGYLTVYTGAIQSGYKTAPSAGPQGGGTFGNSLGVEWITYGIGLRHN